jgi:hypothetical protein
VTRPGVADRLILANVKGKGICCRSEEAAGGAKDSERVRGVPGTATWMR